MVVVRVLDHGSCAARAFPPSLETRASAGAHDAADSMRKSTGSIETERYLAPKPVKR